MADQNVEVTITVKRSDLEAILRRSGGHDLTVNRPRDPHLREGYRSYMPDWYESYLNIQQALKWADTHG